MMGRTPQPATNLGSLTAMSSPDQRSLFALLGQTVADAQRLIAAQVALAKAELASTTKLAGRAAIFGVIALGSMTLFGIFLLITIAYVLVELGLPVWAGFGIVTLLLLLVAGIAGALAVMRAKQIDGPKVIVEELEQTVQELNATLGVHDAQR
jgi:Putative Actinobacterial Holin-X, holin superfamily III